jgi:oligoribonuclease
MKSPTNLVWIDLEMTGLDPDACTIIEIASLVTNADLEILAEGPVFAIETPEDALAAMDEWNTTHHTASGLVDRIRSEGVSAVHAERETLRFVRQWVPRRTSPLCGNSVWQDRRFLTRYMKELEAFFHYRLVDVSTIKELVRRWYPATMQAPKKDKAHLALDDIRESVAELRHYRENIFISMGG